MMKKEVTLLFLVCYLAGAHGFEFTCNFLDEESKLFEFLPQESVYDASLFVSPMTLFVFRSNHLKDNYVTNFQEKKAIEGFKMEELSVTSIYGRAFVVGNKGKFLVQANAAILWSDPSGILGCSVASFESTAYIYGGVDMKSSNTKENVLILIDFTSTNNPEEKELELVSKKRLDPRIGHQSSMIDSKTLLVFGGMNPSGKNFYNDILFIEVKTGLVTSPEGRAPPSRAFFSFSRVGPSSWLVLGGMRIHESLSDAWLYNVRAMEWTEVRIRCPFSSFGHSAFLYNGSTLIAFGGKYILDKNSEFRKFPLMLTFAGDEQVPRLNPQPKKGPSFLAVISGNITAGEGALSVVSERDNQTIKFQGTDSNPFKGNFTWSYDSSSENIDLPWSFGIYFKSSANFTVCVYNTSQGLECLDAFPANSNFVNYNVTMKKNLKWFAVYDNATDSYLISFLLKASSSRSMKREILQTTEVDEMTIELCSDCAQQNAGLTSEQSPSFLTTQTIIIIACSISGGAILLAVLIFAIIMTRKHRKRSQSDTLHLSKIYSKELLSQFNHLKDVEVEQKIGHSVHGPVFLATAYSNTVQVVMKKCNQSNESIQDMAIIAQLSHPNLIKTLGIHFWQDDLYIVQEYAEQGNVLNYLKADESHATPLSLSLIAMDIGKALAFLSSKHIVHKDVRTENILMSNNCAKLANLGFWSAERPAVRYSAPETLEAPRYSESSDAWSFGICMFEMFSGGELPFASVPDTQLRQKLLKEGLVPSKHPKIWTEGWSFIESCCKKDSEARPKFQQLVSDIANEIMKMSMQEGGKGKHLLTSYNTVKDLAPGDSHSHDNYHKITSLVNDKHTYEIFD